MHLFPFKSKPRRQRATRDDKARSIIRRGATPVRVDDRRHWPTDEYEVSYQLEDMSRFVAALNNGETWTDAAGNVHLIAKMDREYALNVLCFLHEHYGAAPAYSPLTNALRRRVLDRRLLP